MEREQRETPPTVQNIKISLVFSSVGDFGMDTDNKKDFGV